jgi:hypothetical protein
MPPRLDHGVGHLIHTAVSFASFLLTASVRSLSSTCKIRGGKSCFSGIDMSDDPVCVVGCFASNFAGSALRKLKRGFP